MIKEIINASKAGGKELSKYFGKAIEVFNKTTIADFRTTADLASEKAILGYLQKRFPDFNYFSEEKGWIKNGSEYTFVIDPLDGTNNFSLGIPNFSVSIALQKNKKVIYGVIYNPILNEVFWAERGKGAFLNKKRINTNNSHDLKQATVSYTCGYKDSGIALEKLIRTTNKLNVKRLTTNWSPALDYCLLASGKIDSVICNGNDIYDNAAGKIIVREANGVITKFNGAKEQDELSTYFIASNNKILHKKILKMSASISNLNKN